MPNETFDINNREERAAMAKHLRGLANALDSKACDGIRIDWESILRGVQEIVLAQRIPENFPRNGIS